MPKRQLLRGTLALTAAGLFSRVAGSFYRILLVRVVGQTGIGIFQMAVPVYSLAATLASLGLPAALAKVVAERAARGDWPGVEQARRTATLLTLAATAVTLVLAWAGTGVVAERVLTDPRTRLSLMIMPAAVAAVAYASVLRGYFQGLQDLIPGAAAQVVEQVVRIATILPLAALLVPYGLGAAAGGAMAGLAAGETAGLICLLVWLRRHETILRPWKRVAADPGARRGDGMAGELLRLGLPAMAGDLVGALTAAADAFIIPRRLLQTGLPWDQATGLYGELMGMVLPILFLPMVLTYPIGMALVPAVSAAHALGNRALVVRRMLLGTRLTLGIALCASAVFYAAPEGLARLLYGDTAVAPLIALLAVAAPFVYVQSLENAILMGLGLNAESFRNYTLGVCVRLSVIYVLTGTSLGIAGALWGIVAGQVVMGLCHARDIRRATGRFPLP